MFLQITKMNIKTQIESEINRLERELSAAKAYLATLGNPVQVAVRIPTRPQKPVKAKSKAPRAKSGELAQAIMSVIGDRPMANGEIRNLAQAKVPFRLDAVKVYKNLALLVKQGKVSCVEVGPRQFNYSLPKVAEPAHA